MHRVNVSFSDEDWKKLQQYCKSIRPYQPVGTTIREILLHGVLACNTLEHAVTGEHTPTQAVPTPSPARARKSYKSSSSDSGKKKEKKREEKRGSVRGGQAELVGTEPPPVSEPFVREVIEHLNETCGTGFPVFSRAVRELIAQLLVDGYTIEDMKTVNRWADRNWPRPDPGEKDWRATMVVPSKLYGEKFGEHLGVARATETKESSASPWRPPADQLLQGPS